MEDKNKYGEFGKDKKRVLITGAAGFIGHHLVEEIIKNTNWDIVILDRLTYASNGFDKLRDIGVYDNPRVNILTCDLASKLPEGMVQEIGDIAYVYHLAAETHVQRSIEDPEPFMKANIMGTFYLLEFVKGLKNLKGFFYFSTDEVFGDAPEGVKYKENDRYNSRNPYAAAKAGGEEITMAYGNTYQIPVIVTHCMNVFGERQHPEKYVSLCIRKIKNGETIKVHINPSNGKPGSRHWIHARNVAASLLFLSEKGKPQEKYNIVPKTELDNLEIAQLIAKFMNLELKYELEDYHSKRPGHDPRYSLCGEKMKKMGWKLPVSFDESFKKTIDWALKEENKKWLDL